MNFARNGYNAMSEIVCPVCGKIFIPAPFHYYKLKKRKLVCSWNCQIEGEKRKAKSALDKFGVK